VRTRTWVVRPGDNLWSIAARALGASWGRPPDVREVGPYWWRVVEVNRPRLPNPSDPNLLFAGDQVTLPPPPADPALGQGGADGPGLTNLPPG
jgi:nucleoid-associated protein YgaU